MNKQPFKTGEILVILLAFIFILSITSSLLIKDKTPLTLKERIEVCPTCVMPPIKG